MIKNILRLAGMVFLVTFAVALLTFGAFILTSENMSRPILAKILNITFRQLGDNGKEVTRIVNYTNALYENKEAIKSMSSSMSKLDPNEVQNNISSMSNEESQKYLEEKLVRPMYQNGTRIIEPLKAVNPDQAISAERLDFISMTNIKSHDSVKKILIFQMIIMGLLLALLVFANKGLKRLYVPGLLLFFASLPGFLLCALFSPLVVKFITPIMGRYANSTIYNAILEEVIKPIINIFLNIHMVPLLTGLALIVLSIVFKFTLYSTAVSKISPTQPSAGHDSPSVA